MATSYSSTHERILSAAYPLFTQRGIRQVSKEEVQRVAGVTTREFDREFSSREDLATECLERREQVWLAGIVQADAWSRGTTPEGRLLAIFDVLDEWFHRDDYEALSRLDELLHMGDNHPLGRANAVYLENMRQLVASLAHEADVSDPDELALSWNVLVTGAINNAVDGDDKAAARAKEMGRHLLTLHRPRWESQSVFATELENTDFDQDNFFEGFPPRI